MVYQSSILSRWFSGIISNQKALIGSVIILLFILAAIISLNVKNTEKEEYNFKQLGMVENHDI